MEITPSSRVEAYVELSEQKREGGCYGAVKKFKAPLVDETLLPRFSIGENQDFNNVINLFALL